MSDRKNTPFNKDWSLRLKGLLRDAVRVAQRDHYIYFTDRAANSDVTILPDFVLQNAKKRLANLECNNSAKKSA